MSKIAFTIFGISVHWYGIMIALGIILAVLLGYFIFKQRNLSTDNLFELLIWCLPFAIIGARLYYLIFNNGPWGWEAFAIWNGGLAVYGSIIGGAVGAILFCLVRKKNFLDVADVAVPCLVLGQAIGRIGCYLGGCCYGVETTNAKFMCFPFSVFVDGSWHLATNLYESFFDLIICLCLVILLKKQNIRGVVFGGYMVLYGILRAILESFRDSAEALFIGSMKVSLLLSLVLVAAGVALIVVQIIRYKKNLSKVK